MIRITPETIEEDLTGILICSHGSIGKQNEGQSYAVTGVNLGMVLEAVGQRESAELERMPEILERTGKDAVINVMDKMKK